MVERQNNKSDRMMKPIGPCSSVHMVTEEEAIADMKAAGCSKAQIFWRFHREDVIMLAFCLFGVLSGL